MSEEAMRFNAGALVLKPSADDRKLSAAVEAKKVIIKSADMKDDLQKEAIDIAISAFEKHNVEKDVAEQIKKEFDRKHGPTWHCIVGKNFGHSLGCQLANSGLPKFWKGASLISEASGQALTVVAKLL
ncbi:hypothetical protein TEA_021060 [Camellia sinensis var. sinensis]|uniref:Dynein light chain n=1 Tax=Camellia sinensis var. sinensis TaxID=542762 RepID=A0A4S4E709_CAMSN|nr:hypothetical protein TEA_021060 [Camellia sinensis var. sinensis]